MADNNRKSSRKYDLEKTPSRSFDLNKDEPSGLPKNIPGGKSKRKNVTVLCIVACAIVSCIIWLIARGEKSGPETESQFAEAESSFVADDSSVVIESESEVLKRTNMDNDGAKDHGGVAEAIPETQITEDAERSSGSEAPKQNPEVDESQNTSVREGNMAASIPTNVSGSNSREEKITINQPKHVSQALDEATSAALWNALDQDAKEVILGTYGNGKKREENLGENYSLVQAKVNEYYRRKYGI